MDQQTLKITFLLLSFVQIAFGQNNFSRAEDLARAQIRRCTTISEQFENGKVVKTTKNIETLDSLGRSREFLAYDFNGKLRSKIVFSYSSDGNTKYYVSNYYGIGGPISYKHVEIVNGNKRRNIQISEKGDTLVNQVLDNSGRENISDSILRFDETGRLIRKILNDKDGKEIKKIEYVNKCILTYSNTSIDNNPIWKLESKKCNKKGQTVEYVLANKTGFLFGIEIRNEVGGKRIVKRNKENLVTEILNTGRNGQKIAKIIFINEK